MKTLLFVILCVLIVAVIIGCSETEDPITAELTPDSTALGTIAKMKVPEPQVAAVPGAPSAPAGTPFVKEVGFYRDWKRTKVLTGTVKPGSTIHIKIVFSEGMQIVLADDKEARPILYHKVGGKLRRFRIVEYKAKGKDFTSGDAKPVGNQATYYARYTVKKADIGEVFTIAVGKFSPDRQGNTLADFYTHGETLQCGPVPPKEPPQEELPQDDPQEQPTDTVPPTVLSITHSYKGEPIESELPDGATIETQIVFSERVIPSITYTTRNETNIYRVSQTVGGVHWRGFCKPTDNTGTVWLCRQNAAQPSFSVTVTTDTVDRAGNHLQEPATTEAMPVTEQVAPPQEPIEEPVQPPNQTPIDAPPTTPQDPTQPAPKRPDDLGYTFTLEGHTYPGYNPSPNLQRILDTHPSAKLPHFLEAVQMEEVIDWVYRKVWTLYPDWKTNPVSVDKMVAAREAVMVQFGMSHAIKKVLSALYFRTDQVPPAHSRYWLAVEYLRLKHRNQDADVRHLLRLFDQSAEQARIVGIENPNN